MTRFYTNGLYVPVLFVSPQQELALGFPWLVFAVSLSLQYEVSKVSDNN